MKIIVKKTKKKRRIIFFIKGIEKFSSCGILVKMTDIETLISKYESFQQKLFPLTKRNLKELASEESATLLPDENLLQGLWLSGSFGDKFVTTQGDKVCILDVGEWNKSAGPDFLKARLLIGGKVFSGDIELDKAPTDWEAHGHGADERFNDVILHVTFQKTEDDWFTRNSRHEEIPMIIIPERTWKKALFIPHHQEKIKGGKTNHPLSTMDEDAISSLLLSAAAIRWSQKAQRFNKVKEQFGLDQALYESLAETLGYNRNKDSMRLLAQRVPFSKLAADAEAILFGVAGFLPPFMEESTTPSARSLHSRLWETWWRRRAEFELNDLRKIRWDFAATRPANRPERRLAALALALNQWRDLRLLFIEPSRFSRSIIDKFASFSHAYWSRHITLPGDPMNNVLALVGKERAVDFLVNHLLPGENLPSSWRTYTALQAPSRSERVKDIAIRLLGPHRDIHPFLTHAWQHQGLLQLHKDFCLESTEEEGWCYPDHIKQWAKFCNA